MALAAVTLDDKYTLEQGRIYLTGTQALVRLPMMQRQRDLAAGLNTACFVSGYRGSPLGVLDQAMWRAKRFLKNNHIHFQPGVNEDLAATACWGSQQVNLFDGARYDGVFAMWYGKGPGVDRCGDVFKHANAAGTSQHGGVLVLAGDDHVAKSSTMPHQSEFELMSAMIPVINPSSVQEFLDLGLHGWALGRYAGVWVGFKCTADTVDTSASVHVDPHRIEIVHPTDFEMPKGGLNIRWPDSWTDQEWRLHQYKLPAVHAYARANRLDRMIFNPKRARFGIITTGKSYLDVRQALDDLGIDEAMAEAIGLRLYKVALTWPLEPQGLREFADGLEEILVVEEKRNLIEDQVTTILYNAPAEHRPRVVGKFDRRGNWILPSAGELEPARIAGVIYERLKQLQDAPLLDRVGANFMRHQRQSAAPKAGAFKRIPYFCSGCPHNSSTKVPEGSMAAAGIGCHFMVLWMDRNTATYTHMGAEGAQWIGTAPFTDRAHLFQNIGDGTYFHSGSMAVRAAVAAGVNITYKILYNDAVAMTGGQPVDGQLTVPQISRQMAAEGASRIAVVTDEPEKYPAGTEFAAGVTIHHRDDLDAVQRELREVSGVSVLIYDQTCATEKRRRRKRGAFPDPDKRVFINELVCEGCGDCGTASNCLSVIPRETEFGRKRAIDQSSCNKDFSCVKGFCPSFVTVHGARPRKAAQQTQGPIEGDHFAGLPEPALPALEAPYAILVAGVGGTGVVTIGALLGMAAHLEGKGVTVLDQIGLAQKYGAVSTHVRIAKSPEQLHAVRIATGDADLVLGCDLVVTAGGETLDRVRSGFSRVVVNTHESPTGDFTRKPDLQFPAQDLRAAIEHAVGADAVDAVEATNLATSLMGDAIATNAFLMGYAWQRGLIPLGREAIERAIELNDVATDFNKRAFAWGRLAAHDPGAIERVLRPAHGETKRGAQSLEELIERRRTFLSDYQNAAYAQRYVDLVRLVETAERDKTPERRDLTTAVARYAFKLMAYKDEYEVARLYTDGSFHKALAAQFGAWNRLEFHLAPPGLAERDPASGHLKKRSFGPWMMTAFRLLAKLRFLRGTAFDPFGRTAERRMERRLVEDYAALLRELTGKLTAENHALAVELASIPEQIRGFGHVKEAHLQRAKTREAELLARFRAPAPAPLAQAAE
jgi:indolepyruvate ferredoxin oxidoreductase